MSSGWDTGCHAVAAWRVPPGCWRAGTPAAGWCRAPAPAAETHLTVVRAQGVAVQQAQSSPGGGQVVPRASGHRPPRASFVGWPRRLPGGQHTHLAPPLQDGGSVRGSAGAAGRAGQCQTKGRFRPAGSRVPNPVCPGALGGAPFGANHPCGQPSQEQGHRAGAHRCQPVQTASQAWPPQHSVSCTSGSLPTWWLPLCSPAEREVVRRWADELTPCCMPPLAPPEAARCAGQPVCRPMQPACLVAATSERWRRSPCTGACTTLDASPNPSCHAVWRLPPENPLQAYPDTPQARGDAQAQAARLPGAGGSWHAGGAAWPCCPAPPCGPPRLPAVLR